MPPAWIASLVLVVVRLSKNAGRLDSTNYVSSCMALACVLCYRHVWPFTASVGTMPDGTDAPAMPRPDARYLSLMGSGMAAPASPSGHSPHPPGAVPPILPTRYPVWCIPLPSPRSTTPRYPRLVGAPPGGGGFVERICVC